MKDTSEVKITVHLLRSIFRKSSAQHSRGNISTEVSSLVRRFEQQSLRASQGVV